MGYNPSVKDLNCNCGYYDDTTMAEHSQDCLTRTLSSAEKLASMQTILVTCYYCNAKMTKDYATNALVCSNCGSRTSFMTYSLGNSMGD